MTRTSLLVVTFLPIPSRIWIETLKMPVFTYRCWLRTAYWPLLRPWICPFLTLDLSPHLMNAWKSWSLVFGSLKSATYPKYVRFFVAWIFRPCDRKSPILEGGVGVGLGLGVGVGVGLGDGLGVGVGLAATVTGVETVLSFGLCEPGTAIISVAVKFPAVA
jgi:hypothetical protein